MAITFVSSSGFQSPGTGSTSLVVSVPASVTTGDFRPAFVIIPSTATITASPTGWPLWLSTVLGSYRVAIYSRFVQSGDGDVTWSFSSSVAYMIFTNAYRGVDPNKPFDVAPSPTTCTTATSGTTITGAALTANDTLSAPIWLLNAFFATNASTATISVPSICTSNGVSSVSTSAQYGCRWARLTAAPTAGTPTAAPTSTLSQAAPWNSVGMVLRDPNSPGPFPPGAFLPYFRA